MNQTVLSKYDLITVGEAPGVTPVLAEKYTGFDRHELEMVFQFKHMGLDDDPQFGKWSLHRPKLTDLKRVLSVSSLAVPLACEPKSIAFPYGGIFFARHSRMAGNVSSCSFFILQR